jgi:hypothetical protein
MYPSFRTFLKNVERGGTKLYIYIIRKINNQKLWRNKLKKERSLSLVRLVRY